jgi:hypothetical protein
MVSINQLVDIVADIAGKSIVGKSIGKKIFRGRWDID